MPWLTPFTITDSFGFGKTGSQLPSVSSVFASEALARLATDATAPRLTKSSPSSTDRSHVATSSLFHECSPPVWAKGMAFCSSIASDKSAARMIPSTGARCSAR